MFINLNGELLNADEPVFTIRNRAFRYGDAIFETIRVVNGEICFLHRHVKRLLDGMATLQLDVPKEFSEAFFKEQIGRIIEKNAINKGGRVRITVYRKSGGYYTPETNAVSFVIEAVPLPDNEYALNSDGLTIDLYEEQKLVIHKLSTVKTNNCLTHVLAALYKKNKGLDECVMVNELGGIAECISSNLFVGYNGVLYTPSLNQGIIPGIMREVIIDIASEKNIEVQECTLTPQVLLRADEVFLTNAINGIRWVVAYRSKRYFNKTSKLLVPELNARLAKSLV